MMAKTDGVLSQAFAFIMSSRAIKSAIYNHSLSVLAGSRIESLALLIRAHAWRASYVPRRTPASSTEPIEQMYEHLLLSCGCLAGGLPDACRPPKQQSQALMLFWDVKLGSDEA
jgi:hypothetical protein